MVAATDEREGERRKDKKKQKKQKSKLGELEGLMEGSELPPLEPGESGEEEREEEEEEEEEEAEEREEVVEGVEGEGNGGEEEAEHGEQQKKRRRQSIEAGGLQVKISVKPSHVLPWMRVPVEIKEEDRMMVEDVPHLDDRLRAALVTAGIQAFFPVQSAVWRHLVGPTQKHRDLCVCAPTGSGKTFSYVLPIVQSLSKRVVKRLRALVVLPTRDLATQVKAVFDLIAPAVGLSVGLAIGQTALQGEADALVALGDDKENTFVRADLLKLFPTARRFPSSRVDILVATPGRLVDHMSQTPGFSLEHLHFLVVDETDRLLRQAYQDWLPKVLAAAEGGGGRGASWHTDNPAALLTGQIRTTRRLEAEWGTRSFAEPRLVKLALSATLTRDPSKIGRLHLCHPLYIAASASDHRYALPKQLKEFKIVCESGEKPLYLIALLQHLGANRRSTIVFTASLESTHRLYLLLCAYKGLGLDIKEYSSLLPQRERSAALTAFREGKATVLVASDAMTRGMDVDDVAAVVSYDAPVYAKTYVHRVGRTARAGKDGAAYTILRKTEVRHFKGMLRKANNNLCKDFKIGAEALEPLVAPLQDALEVLRVKVGEEAAVGRGPKAQLTTHEEKKAHLVLGDLENL